MPAEPGPGFRSRAQIVFQNPDSSLNPRKTVAEIIRRPIVLFGIAKGRAADAEVDRLLDLVRLSPAYRDRFPHDPEMRTLSGWAAFESDHPDTFARMYQFWVRKPA